MRHCSSLWWSLLFLLSEVVVVSVTINIMYNSPPPSGCGFFIAQIVRLDNKKIITTKAQYQLWN